MQPQQYSMRLSGGCAATVPVPVAERDQFRRHGEHDRSRAAVQAFIEGVYARHYGARIDSWAPLLVSLQSQGRIVAAAGYRPGEAPLYLERYLREPIEGALAARTGIVVQRAGIVEIGHLASRRPGAGTQLMSALGRHLRAAGFEWAVITATAELRAILERLRIHHVVLGPADPQALGASAARWGTYYRHAPWVIAGEIAGNLARLQGAARR